MERSDHPYEYQTLPTPRSIRLVKPTPGNAPGNWSCSLVIVDLDNDPEYFALSYCWGDIQKLKPIICDEATIMVTETAFGMLEAFCKNPEPFWIDSLCINQADISEKNRQVSLMAEIYQKAQRVAVWLGPDHLNDGPTLRAAMAAMIEMIGTIHAYQGIFDHLDPENGELHWTLPDGRTVAFLPVPSLLTSDENGCNRLHKFFGLEWFSRTWILQEVGLAAEAHLYWGELGVDWHGIGLLALFLVRHGSLFLDHLGLTNVTRNVCHIYTAFSPYKPLATFFHLLNSSRRLKATNPRDKVYALLSHPTACTISVSRALPKNTKAFLASKDLAIQFLPSLQDQYLVQQRLGQQNVNASSQDVPTEPLIKADYSKSTTEVFRELALAHIHRTETLEILTAVQHHPATLTPSSPSWAPNWNEHIDTPTLGLETSKHFASANKSAIVRASSPEEPNTLIVRGTIFSQVSFVSPLCDSSSFDLKTDLDPDVPPPKNQIMASWMGWGLHELHAQRYKYPRAPQLVGTDGVLYYGNEYSLWEAYMRTWTAGKGLSEVDGFDPEGDPLACWKRLSQGEPCPEDVTLRAERYRLSVAAVASQRKFFITKKCLFGLGPGAMRKGDWVAVLLGADVPFILREVGAHPRPPKEPFAPDVKFQLVGECYVDGLMTGGAVKGVEITRDVVLV